MNATPYSTERWQVRPDIPDDLDPNSGKDIGVDQEWFDQYNFIARNPTTKGCKDEGDADTDPTDLETYNQALLPLPYGRRLPPLGLQPVRSTVTVSHT